MATARLSLTKVVPTSRELALSHYFRNRIKYTCPDELNAELWQKILPQMSHGAAVVWHAVNALAGSVWARDVGAGLAVEAAETFKKESIRQHSMCVRYLLITTQSPHVSAQEKTIVLLANAVLRLCHLDLDDTRFFQLVGRNHELIWHWKIWEHINSNSLSTLVTQILLNGLKSEGMRRESQFLMPVRPAFNWHEAIACLQKRAISSAVEAYIEIQMIWSSVQAALDGMPVQPSGIDITSAYSERSALQRSFAAWEMRYYTLISMGCNISRVHLAVIEARRVLLTILFRINLSRFSGLWDETCWDEFEPSFRTALLLIESILVPNDQQKHYFTPLLWNCLNFIARACRRPILRRRAAALLQASLRDAFPSLPAGQGREDSWYILVDFIISLEEAGWDECNEARKCVRDEFICNMHRVARIHTEQPEGKCAVFIFRTVGDILNGRHGTLVSAKGVLRWS